MLVAFFVNNVKFWEEIIRKLEQMQLEQMERQMEQMERLEWKIDDSQRETRSMLTPRDSTSPF